MPSRRSPGGVGRGAARWIALAVLGSLGATRGDVVQEMQEKGFALDLGLLQMLDEVMERVEKEGGGQHKGRALQLGCGTGVYTDYLKTGGMKYKRYVNCVDPERKTGVFQRKGGPHQEAVNILDPTKNTEEWREKIGKYHLVFTLYEPSYFPPEKHVDTARFLAELLVPGGVLVFLAAIPGQPGYPHGGRRKGEWKEMFREAGLEFEGILTEHARTVCDSFINMKTVSVYRAPGTVPKIS